MVQEEEDEEDIEEREAMMKASEIKAEMLQVEEAYTAAQRAGIDVTEMSSEEVLRMMTSRWTRKQTPGKKPAEEQDVVDVTGSAGKSKGKGKGKSSKGRGKKSKVVERPETADQVPVDPVPVDPVPVDPVPVDPVPEEQEKEQKGKPKPKKQPVAKKSTAKPHHVQAVADVHVDSEIGKEKVVEAEPTYLVQAKYNVSRVKVDKKKKEMVTSDASINVITPSGSAKKKPGKKEPNVVYEVVRKLDTFDDHEQLHRGFQW